MGWPQGRQCRLTGRMEQRWRNKLGHILVMTLEVLSWWTSNVENYGRIFHISGRTFPASRKSVHSGRTELLDRILSTSSGWADHWKIGFIRIGDGGLPPLTCCAGTIQSSLPGSSLGAYLNHSDMAWYGILLGWIGLCMCLYL